MNSTTKLYFEIFDTFLKKYSQNYIHTYTCIFGATPVNRDRPSYCFSILSCGACKPEQT